MAPRSPLVDAGEVEQDGAALAAGRRRREQEDRVLGSGRGRAALRYVEPIRFRAHLEKSVEALAERRPLPPLRGGGDGDVRNARTPDALAVPAEALAHVGGDEPAGDGGPVPACDLDQGRAVRDGGVDVVDGDGPPRRQRLADERELVRLLVAPPPHEVLADQDMRRRKALAIEARLPGRREADEDHQLRHDSEGYRAGARVRNIATWRTGLRDFRSRVYEFMCDERNG
jgi:hypothetical protein